MTPLLKKQAEEIKKLKLKLKIKTKELKELQENFDELYYRWKEEEPV